MYAVVLDAEMTDNRPGQICQLAYIKVGGGGLCGINYYFTVDDISPDAYLVHGLDKEKLKKLSGGLAFSASAENIAGDLAGAAVLVGHNVGQDARFLQIEMERAGVAFSPPPLFCTMKETTEALCLPRRFGGPYKPPRLDELCAHYGVTEERARTLAQNLFGTPSSRHDARYDAAACCLCCFEGIGRGEMPPFFSFAHAFPDLSAGKIFCE